MDDFRHGSCARALYKSGGDSGLDDDEQVEVRRRRGARGRRCAPTGGAPHGKWVRFARTVKSCGLGVVHDSERHQPDSRSGDTQNGLHADQPVASMIQLAVSEIQR